jgi:hypothetical protein
MPNRKLRTICPHCNRALERDADEDAERNDWLICTPLPADIIGPRKGEVKGESKGEVYSR